MHTLLILFSTLGGIALFGIVGFILGPILAAVFLTVTDIYASEYREELESLTYGGTSPTLSDKATGAEQSGAPDATPNDKALQADVDSTEKADRSEKDNSQEPLNNNHSS